MVLVAEQRDDKVALVIGGCRRDELRRAAVRVCAGRFGGGDWRVSEESFRPTMMSRTGSVRLWEGRFELVRS
jgi:hypothetical protein